MRTRKPNKNHEGTKSSHRILLEGAFFIQHSFASTNRCLAAHFSQVLGNFGILPHDNTHESGEHVLEAAKLQSLIVPKCDAEVTIRHFFPPDFSIPESGSLVIMQPWEFLGVPERWMRGLSESRAELWVNSTFTRNVYVNNGFDPRRVRCLPLGIDTEVFSPRIAPDSTLLRDDEFRFLFVGGTIQRKGIDILLSAYCQEFSRKENVRLVIKDTGTKHVYVHNNHADIIKSIIADENQPRITYLEDDLSVTRLAAVYTACHCLTIPYRGEGFCMPVLEAMACGLPVIVPSGGATDDIVLHSTGWRVAARFVEIPQLPSLESKCNQGWLEPNIDDLRRAMREAFEGRASKTLEFGKNAASLVERSWTWDSVIPMYVARIKEILSQRVPATSSNSSLKKEPFVSLCMIVRNEERVLENCLRSAKPFFDEIVVVDTGSSDRSKTIATKYADVVTDFEWVDDFASARNESLRHATGDWIAWLDADDTLPAETGEMIRNAVARADSGVIGFVLPIQFLDDEGRPTGTRVDHVKLFRNLPGVKFEGRLHEQILPSLNQIGGSIVRCPGLILHSGYDISPEGQKKKRERDFKLLALDLEERPNHPFVLFNVGMTHHYTGGHEEAVSWLAKSIANARQNESHIRKAYSMMGVSQRELGDHSAALETFKKGLESVGVDPELYFQLALTLSSLDRKHEAIEAYEKALHADISGHYSSFDIGITGFRTMHNIGALYLSMGDYPNAKAWLLQAINDSPTHSLSVDLLANAAVDFRDFPLALTMLDHMERNHGPDGSWVPFGCRYFEQIGGNSSVERFLMTALQQHPDSVSVKQAWSRFLLNSERVTEAIPILSDLQAKGVPEAAFFLGVVATRSGDFAAALRWMERAHELNPDHEETVQQLDSLKAALSD